MVNRGGAARTRRWVRIIAIVVVLGLIGALALTAVVSGPN
jgi:hypothetical protein